MKLKEFVADLSRNMVLLQKTCPSDRALKPARSSQPADEVHPSGR